MTTDAPADDAEWIILRCAGKSTLALASSLAEDGFQVWTPAKTVMLRKPRMNVRRQVRLPIVPSFVFAGEQHVVDLLQLAALPVKPRRGAGGRLPAHRDFSVFHFQDEIPVIADAALEPLREAERDAVPRKKRSRFAGGETVRVTRGSFEGMTGVVERSDDRDAQVWLSLFGRHYRTKIPTSLLKLDELSTRPKPD